MVSPIDGRVSKAVITRGNLVTPSDLLTTVVSDTPIYAAFNADEQTFLKYAAAERGKASPVYMGLMTEDGYPHQGKLEFIDNALDAKSGTINGRAIFANADGRFTPACSPASAWSATPRPPWPWRPTARWRRTWASATSWWWAPTTRPSTARSRSARWSATCASSARA